MLTATKDLVLPTTVTGSWPRPSWFTGNLFERPFSTGMSDVADTTVTPGVAEVIVTVQLAVAAPPVYVQVAGPTNEPGPLTIEAVAVCGPASIVPPNAFTVIVNTWFVPISFDAVGGEIWMFASTQFFVAGPELPF